MSRLFIDLSTGLSMRGQSIAHGKATFRRSHYALRTSPVSSYYSLVMAHEFLVGEIELKAPLFDKETHLKDLKAITRANAQK